MPNDQQHDQIPSSLTGLTQAEAAERAAAGKLVFLYTDSGCTFQFYEHRGFSREETSKVPIHHGKRSFNLDCYLYAKQL